MERLATRIERFLRTGEGDFDSLALELFRYQFERNQPYQAFCRAQNAAPERVDHWQNIPAVPVHAFKAADLTTFPPAQAAAVFHSSATTRGTPSRHYLRDLAFYEASLKTMFAKWMLPDNAALPFLILTPPPGEAPRSSLVWMFEVVRRQWGKQAGKQDAVGSDYFLQRGRLDDVRLSAALNRTRQSGQPVALLGTTLAFLAFFDACAKHQWSWKLPSGSRLLDTGGMKTERREISRPAFLDLVQERLGIPEYQCVNEYGMCEMSSQFYGRGRSTRLHGPAWVRTLAIDPLSGEPAALSQRGLLRHFDLANIDSVLAIQTDDLGEVEAEGFQFYGRAPEAELKGCSLMTEVFLRPVS